MASKSTHIKSVITLLDILPKYELRKAASGHTTVATLGALANYLQFETDSVAFIKTLQWVSVFIQDGRDTILKSSLSDENKKAAVELYAKISSPFIYPFPPNQATQHIRNTLSETSRSHLSLLSEWIQKESPIYVPDPEDISLLIADLAKIGVEFSKLDLPGYLKEDFSQHLQLYITISEKIPFVAHQLLIHEATKLSAWLLSNLPQEAKRVIVKAATVVNLLVAAFIAPAEASDAYSTYYAWAAQAQPEAKQLMAAAAPLQLPPPAKPSPNTKN
jgi:hypothetical protein